MEKYSGALYAVLAAVAVCLFDAIHDVIYFHRSFADVIIPSSAGDAFFRAGIVGAVIIPGFLYTRLQGKRRRAADDMLSKNELLQKKLLDTFPQEVYFKDLESKYLFCNRYFAAARKTTEAGIRGKYDADLYPPAIASRIRASDIAVMNGGFILDSEEECHANGKKCYVHVIKTPVRDGQGKVTGLLCVQHDITERVLTKQKAERHTRLYLTLSKANQQIVHIKDRDRLLQSVCEVAVEDAGFKMAWIGMLDAAGNVIVPVAKWGDCGSYVDGLRISAADVPEGRGPTGIAFRTGVHVICGDIQNDPNMLPWRENAVKAGFQASGSFPIKIEGVTLGALNVYSADPSFFGDEEVALLDSLAENLSFGIEAIRNEERRRGAVLELAEHNRTLDEKVALRTRELTAANEDLQREVEAHRATAADLRMKARLLDNASDSIFMLDMNGIILYANRTAYRGTGYDYGEYIGKHISILNVANNYPAFFKEKMEEIMRNGESVFEARHRHANGDIIPVEVHSRIIEIDGKRYVMGVTRDISERVKAAGVLRQTQAHLSSFVNGFRESAAMIKPDGTILMANSVFMNRLGLTQKEVVGMNVFDFLPPAIAANRRVFVDQAAKTRQPVVFTDVRASYHLRHELFPVLDDHGNVTAIGIMAYDITDIMVGQQELSKAKDEAEEATKLKDKFVALLSHDMKTPLMGLIGLFQLLGGSPRKDEKETRLLAAGLRSCQDTVKMIDELLDVSRIKTGRLKLKLSDVDGADVVQAAVSAVEKMAAEKGVVIENKVPRNSPVHADPVFLRHVFQNLLTNAIKFSKQSQTVTISLCEGERLIFQVEDNGIGIPAEKHAAVLSFDGAAGSSAGTAGEKGTGLGLPLSNDIILAHQGKLEAVPNPAGGTRMLVHLPRKS